MIAKNNNAYCALCVCVCIGVPRHVYIFTINSVFWLTIGNDNIRSKGHLAISEGIII